MEEELLKGKTLLVVDDEADLRDIVASELEFMGAIVHQAENINIAQKILNVEKIDLIISDIRMPGGTGIDLLEIVKARGPEKIPMILITGFADITTEDAFHKGAEALVNKPFKLDDLIKMAVRYTSSFEDRFSQSLEAEKSLSSVLTDSDVSFGRGGLALTVDTQGSKFEIGEPINIDFKIDGHEIEGQAICRWLRQVDHSSGKSFMGLEFYHLTHESLDDLKDLALTKPIIPYIPSSQDLIS